MNQYARGELRPDDESANFVTHGFGFLLSLVAAGFLLSLRNPDQGLHVAVLVYCFALTGLYCASTLSHMFEDIERRRFYRMLDQVFIFILISGSVTPFAVKFDESGWFSVGLILEWGITIVGIVLCLWFWNLPPRFRILYGIQGWLPVLTMQSVFQLGSAEMIHLLVAGGLLYTLGTLFLVFDNKVKFFHACWHVSVILGSTCHYFAILMLVRPE